ncbi:hypothetical protein [Natrarchaeobaculum aegyptiacum]|uniref:Uncharacterized protein n=1 Tax=Natrarchaeobaculum aegyptiacum TaxID=745377 RepID=A0A2Z2HNM6_9EURY|nr:hypothetical protein [Natrarchaeobaculum aegyptiacum]ARS88556.1 hypothetical protein B1756_01475 [Natrarchaeobaculum aegyptiacum]
MSVIRQPGVLGRTTRRRVVGVTGALATATIETVAVGLWFLLVVESRSTTTALAGLTILFLGSTLRTGLFFVLVDDLVDLLQPRRIGAALALTAGWLGWLFVAESIGGTVGIVVATVVLAPALVVQLFAERRACRVGCRPASNSVLPLVLPALLLAVGASSLLASAWLTDWSIVTPPLGLEGTAIALRIEAIQVGLLVFGLFAFLAHQRRFQRVIDP